MRTDLAEELAGTRVRAVVTVGALLEISEHRDDFVELGQRVGQMNIADIRAVLVATMKAAGDLKPLEVVQEVDRLIEDAGLEACASFAERLLVDAMTKVESAFREADLGNPQSAVTPDAAPA